MNSTKIIEQIAEDGIKLAVSSPGRLEASGIQRKR